MASYVFEFEGGLRLDETCELGVALGVLPGVGGKVQVVSLTIWPWPPATAARASDHLIQATILCSKRGENVSVASGLTGVQYSTNREMTNLLVLLSEAQRAPGRDSSWQVPVGTSETALNVRSAGKKNKQST